MIIENMNSRIRAVHKVCHARGEGVREGVRVCEKGETSQEHVMPHL